MNGVMLKRLLSENILQIATELQKEKLESGYTRQNIALYIPKLLRGKGFGQQHAAEDAHGKRFALAHGKG